MKAPSAPAAPDPNATGQAQAASNIATATAQNTMGLVDKYGPTGSETYNVISREKQSDGLGGTYEVPRYSQTTTLTPEQQKIFDLGQQTETNIAGIGRDQSARIGDLLGKPVNISNEATEGRLFDLATKRLNPQFARDEETLRTRLANSGIRQGSRAWDTEMGGFNERKNDALNQLLLTGRGQAVQEAMAERNQPINEISALLSNSQVSAPQFNSPQTANVAGVDYSGIVRDKYQADMAAYNAKLNSHNAMMGGLFGLAAAPFQMLKFAPSDRRLKRDIRKTGANIGGLSLYEYRIFGRREFGVMAQEALAVRPDAVRMNGFGWLEVDYERLVA